MNKAAHLMVIFATLLVLVWACSKDDGRTKPDSVVEPAQKSSDKQMISFHFAGIDADGVSVNISAEIDEQAKAVTATVPSGTEITALEPTVEISPKATLNPKGTQDFTSPINYTITAEDGTTATYQTTVSLLPSSEKQMISFRFLGIDADGLSVDISADIDEENKTITAIMPSGTDVTALEPSVEVSPEATVDPEGAQDFTDPRNYTITAGDGSSTTYVVTVTAALTEKEILLLISGANPGNTLGWDANDNLANFNRVILDGNGSIIELNINLRGLIILPPEIGQLGSLEKLNLSYNALSTLPPEIGQLGSLEFLYLGNNNLTFIPAEIGQLGSLKELDLSDNNLSTLPVEITQLVNLTFLDLRDNYLSRLDYIPGTGEIAFNACPTNLELLRLAGNADPIVLDDCICNLDMDNGGTVDIDVVPDEVRCEGEVITGKK